MTNGTFMEQKSRSPGGLAIVIALHGAAITALLLAKHEFEREKPIVTKIYDVPIKKDPPPLPPEPRPIEKVELPTEPVITRTPPIIQLPKLPETPLNPVEKQPVFPVPPIGGTGAGTGTTPRVEPSPIPTPLPPVRVAARIDPRAQLQPAYPPSEERAGREGSVTVRVGIGANGRVTSVARVRATSEAFFRATERQALRHWRFSPATVDGRPVASEQVMTVHFQLKG